MSKAGNEYTDKQIEELEKELTEVYSRAGDELEKKASVYFARFEKQDKEKQKLVAEGKMSKADYNKWRTASMTTGKHWKTLKEQSAKTLLEANKNATKLANDRLPSVYMFNYNDVGKDAQDTIKGFSFDLINEQALARMLKDKKTLLPYKVVDGKKVERWDTRKINAEVTQGIIQGESVQKIAKRFRNVSEMDKRYSLLNARTAMTGAENRGTLDGMAKLEEDGVILHKVWISSHDRRVRQSHQHIDGESVPVKEEFGNGLMYPGDPDGDPEEVYGCRCSMTTEITGFRKMLAPSIGSLKYPERPRRRDYDDEETYLKDKLTYESRREYYKNEIERVADKTLDGSVFNSTSELKEWADKNGITIDDAVIDGVDIRVFNTVKPVLEDMHKRFPEIIDRYEIEDFDGKLVKTSGFNIGTTKDGFLSANGGLNFNLSYFGKGEGIAEDGIKTALDDIANGYLVRADGSFAGLIRHEYGHNVQTYIELKMSSEHHYMVDDWRKNFKSFSDYEKARDAYYAKKEKYEKELRSLYGLKGASDYSNVNSRELFAEGFADYTSGGTSEFAVKFGEFLERWYNK